MHAVRNPADWRQIEVDGADNLKDMRRFIDDVTDPNSSDRLLTAVIQTSGVDLTWLRRTLAEHYGGVWIYLRYVLDEIRDGMREASQVDRLPADLAGYYCPTDRAMARPFWRACWNSMDISDPAIASYLGGRIFTFTHTDYLLRLHEGILRRPVNSWRGDRPGLSQSASRLEDRPDIACGTKALRIC